MVAISDVMLEGLMTSGLGGIVPSGNTSGTRVLVPGYEGISAGVRGY